MELSEIFEWHDLFNLIETMELQTELPFDAKLEERFLETLNKDDDWEVFIDGEI